MNKINIRGFEYYLIITSGIIFYFGVKLGFNWICFLAIIPFVWAGWRLKEKSDKETKIQDKLIGLDRIKDNLNELRSKYVPASNRIKTTKVDKIIFEILEKLGDISKDMEESIKNGRKKEYFKRKEMKTYKEDGKNKNKRRNK